MRLIQVAPALASCAAAILLLQPSSAQQPGGGVPPKTVDQSYTMVQAGQTKTNADGVEVDNGCNEPDNPNTADSTGIAKLDPKTGDDASETSVSTKSGFKGKITGLDENDSVVLGSSSGGKISGVAGTDVRLKGGTTVTVENTSQPSDDPGAEEGAPFLEVDLPSGGKIKVHAGSSVTVVTS